MPRLQGVSPGDARRFRSGRPCIDFAHTGGEGPLAVFELLGHMQDVERWLGVILEVDIVAEGDAGLDDVVALRRAIWKAANSLATGGRVADRDRGVINRAATRPPIVPSLTRTGEASNQAPASTGQALSTLARDAIDLFGSPLAQRLRICAAEDCGLLFVDQSRPGTRRWCSMQRCGNLAKVRRYRTPPDLQGLS